MRIWALGLVRRKVTILSLTSTGSLWNFIQESRKIMVVELKLNWFSVEFHQGEAKNTGGGAQTQLSVDDVDEFYEEVKSKGMKPESEPQDTPMKRREFILLDPDGYKLAFFTKK
jgi:uncharacterized glyoxalase superfamily protein PhnB